MVTACTAAVAALGVGRCARGSRTRRRAGFGPIPYEAKQRQEATTKDEVSRRVAFVVCENQKGMAQQLSQYGYCQVDGFLGGSINGYPDNIREEMKKLFDRGWFQQESEQDASFKVGQYRITNQDTEYRFMSKLLGTQPGDEEGERKVETQYEVAPTVVNFTRSLVASLAGPIGRVFGGTISTNVAIAEMTALCGNGARYDRRVSNVFGWNTEKGFAPDPRKLTAIYFANPSYRDELGGHLQLEGVITPTGAASIAPVHDRLVLFWSDKTVWSVRPSQASIISEHQFAIVTHLMAQDHKQIKYNPAELARWFPELQGKPMDWPPKGLVGPSPVG